MMKYQIKLNSTLTFESERERDIIEQLENLISRHKLGGFISELVRAAFQDEGFLTRNGVSLEDWAVENTREEFFELCRKELSEQHKKIDEIYKMASELYNMSIIGKKLGLEQKRRTV